MNRLIAISFRSIRRFAKNRIVSPFIRWINPAHQNLPDQFLPTSSKFGTDRGLAIDRYYIETFLLRKAADIKGRVLEIGENTYTRRFGGRNVIKSEVLHAVKGNLEATIIGNLETGENIPVDVFDAVILTQVLPFVFDVRTAISNTYRSLKSGGILLATLSGISQISRYDMDRWGDYWRFTSASARKLFAGQFGEENIEIETFGNVCVACAFLQGFAAEELSQEQKDFNDKNYQVIISIRAKKK
jgi:SAM-dependent methyltransferase